MFVMYEWANEGDISLVTKPEHSTFEQIKNRIRCVSN